MRWLIIPLIICGYIIFDIVKMRKRFGYLKLLDEENQRILGSTNTKSNDRWKELVCESGTIATIETKCGTFIQIQ